MKRLPIALTVAAFALISGTAFATDYKEPESGGVKIFGEVVNQTIASRNVNYAYGKKARAYQSIGTIHSGTEVYGALVNQTIADYNINVADGDEALACQSIGSIGEFPACQEKAEGYEYKY